MARSWMWVLALVSLALPAERPQGPQVTHQARALQPGEVVTLTVESPETWTRVEARAFDRTFHLYPDKSGRIWHGLVGIDLNVAAGDHRIVIRARDQKGESVVARHSIRIRSKSFPTRRLTVDEKYVNPPKEELERIERESQKVREIFAKVTDIPLWRGSFAQPVPGEPSSSFGKRSILNGRPRSPHSGADFDAKTGAPVHAPNAGKIVLAAPLYFSGNTVIVDHGLGIYSYLAHLSRITVTEGSQVERGDLLGHVGATGRVTGPHLHWAIRIAGARVDPMSLLAASETMTSP